jgi:hypothetical protein
MPATSAESCLEEVGRRAGVPLTWVATIDSLPLAVRHRGAAATPSGVALDIPGTPTRQELRQIIARAAAEAPGLDAVVIRGPLPADHRRVLVDGGIRVACRDRFDDVSRGARRPAPAGWPCRSSLWGLWEVTMARATPPGIVDHLLPWRAGTTSWSGSLSVIDATGAGPAPDAATIRCRIESWKTWAARRRGPGQPVFATLSDLPSLIAGAGRLAMGGSILKAA